MDSDEEEDIEIIPDEEDEDLTTEHMTSADCKRSENELCDSCNKCQNDCCICGDLEVNVIRNNIVNNDFTLNTEEFPEFGS